MFHAEFVHYVIPPSRIAHVLFPIVHWLLPSNEKINTAYKKHTLLVYILQKIILTKDVFFWTIYHHTKFQDFIISGAGGAPILQVCVAVILVLLI
jgi:hypothetical protein